eukprot:366462-Chlamydomonas_euryale.AAC.20
MAGRWHPIRDGIRRLMGWQGGGITGCGSSYSWIGQAESELQERTLLVYACARECNRTPTTCISHQPGLAPPRGDKACDRDAACTGGGDQVA